MFMIESSILVPANLCGYLGFSTTPCPSMWPLKKKCDRLFTQIWFNSDLDLKDELIGVRWSEVFWILATSPNYISSSLKKKERKTSRMINDKVRLSKVNFILIS